MPWMSRRCASLSIFPVNGGYRNPRHCVDPFNLRLLPAAQKPRISCKPWTSFNARFAYPSTPYESGRTTFAQCAGILPERAVCDGNDSPGHKFSHSNCCPSLQRGPSAAAMAAKRNTGRDQRHLLGGVPVRTCHRESNRFAGKSYRRAGALHCLQRSSSSGSLQD